MNRKAITVALCLAWPTVSAALELGPPPEFRERDPERVKLGQLLFYDPILSGNQQVSCAT